MTNTEDLKNLCSDLGKILVHDSLADTDKHLILKAIEKLGEYQGVLMAKDIFCNRD